MTEIELPDKELPPTSVEDLSFVRLRIPSLIPKELIEAVKGRTFSVEQFMTYQEMQVDNPFNYLYALVDHLKKIRGYLWAESNLLDGSLFVNTFSVEKSLWNKGQTLHKVHDLLKRMRKDLGIHRIFWITTNEKFFIKHGFKRSKNCLMEYNLE